MNKTIEEALKCANGLRIAIIDNKLFYNLDNGMFLREDGRLSYICALCSTSHDTYEAYAACVQKCAKQKKDEEERKRKEELEAQRNERLDTIKSAYDDLYGAINDYVKDYGSIELASSSKAGCSPFSPLWPFYF